MKVRRCNKCKITSDKARFKTDKNVCCACDSLRQKEARRKKNPNGQPGPGKRKIENALPELLIETNAVDFSNPDEVRQHLGPDLLFGLQALKATVKLNQNRLNGAIRSNYATDIKEAEIAFRRSVEAYNSLLMRMGDMLDGFSSGNEGKDVEFPDAEMTEAGNVIDVAPYESESATSTALG